MTHKTKILTKTTKASHLKHQGERKLNASLLPNAEVGFLEDLVWFESSLLKTKARQNTENGQE